MAKYEALDIARWFLWKNDQVMDYGGGDAMSLLKLLKLLYYAEGSSLAINGTSLFDEDIVAWEHGPVVESVWRFYNDDPYSLPFGSDEDYDSIDKISEGDKELLEDVYDVFGRFSAWGLRNKTHEEDPWKTTTDGGKQLNGVIDRNLIKDYFVEHYVQK